MKHVLLIGAGFSGFVAAQRLARYRDPGLRITLIDPKDHFLFAPLLIDVLQGDMKPEDITLPLPEMAKKFGIEFVQAKVTGIDREKKLVTIENVEGEKELPYDFLVLSQGAQTNYYGNAGAEKHAFPLKTIKDAARLRSRIEWAVQQAMTESDPAIRRRLLSFAVVGAGATGIEALCSMQDIAMEAAREKSELLREMQFHIFQAANQILPGFPQRMVQFALQECARRGFFVHCGVPVAEVSDTSISCADGSRFESCCILWSAGLAPNNIPASMDFPKAGPWLQVDAFLRITQDIFAAGDIVSASYEKVIVPKNAQTAKQMGAVLAENIHRTLIGRTDLKKFRYFSKGTLLVMGQNGYGDFRFFGLPGAWVGKIRKLFYRITLWQMTRK